MLSFRYGKKSYIRECVTVEEIILGIIIQIRESEWLKTWNAVAVKRNEGEVLYKRGVIWPISMDKI